MVEGAVAARGRKAEQSEATRSALLRVARRFFAERGYAAAPTEEIVHAAGVTRGALYHHFRDKRDLFEATYCSLQDELGPLLSRAFQDAAEQGPWAQLKAGVHAYLDYFMDPAVQRIMLIDAPVVLGWERWREIESKFTLGRLDGALTFLRDEGELGVAQPIEVIAHLLMGLINEASMVISGADDPATARAQAGELVDHVLDGLQAR
jgi:AcrR family transcriptional regulator